MTHAGPTGGYLHIHTICRTYDTYSLHNYLLRLYNTSEKPFEHEVLGRLHFLGSPCSDVLTSIIYPRHESSPLNASLAATQRSFWTFRIGVLLPCEGCALCWVGARETSYVTSWWIEQGGGEAHHSSSVVCSVGRARIGVA